MKTWMRWIWTGLLACLGAAGGLRADPAGKIAVKFVVVTDLDFAAKRGHPGLFETWVSSEHLGQSFAIPGLDHPVAADGRGTLAVLVGSGSQAAAAVMALAADERFDFSRAYWLMTGVGFANPNQLAMGSAVWATAVVNGDWAYETDRADASPDWPYGIVPLNPSNVPADYPAPAPRQSDGVVYAFNRALTKLAFSLSAARSLPELPEARSYRGLYAGYPAAIRPPAVLVGTIVASARAWRGRVLNQWATDWVQYWTKGGDPFLLSDTSDQAVAGGLATLARMGRVDFARVMALRGACGYTLPPPDQAKDKSLADGFVGPGLAAASAYLVGRPIFHEITEHWDRYADKAP